MQAKKSTEVHEDFWGEQPLSVDKSESVLSKSPQHSNPSSPISGAPVKSVEVSSDTSESQSHASASARSHEKRLVPAADSKPLAAQVSSPPEKVEEKTADSSSRSFKRACAPRGKSRDSQITFPASAKRFIRRREVQHLTGLSRSSLYRLIAEKDFPKAIALSPNTVAWLESEIIAWILDRVSAPPRPKKAKKSSKKAKKDTQATNPPTSRAVAPLETEFSNAIPNEVSTPLQHGPARKPAKVEG